MTGWAWEVSWNGAGARVLRCGETEGDAPIWFGGAAEDPVINLGELIGFGLPGVVAADVVLGGAALLRERGGIGSEGGEESAEVGDDLFAAVKRKDVAGAGGDEFGRAAVVEDDGGQAEGHGFEHDAAAELAQAGEDEDIALLEAGLELVVVHPAVEADGGLDLELVDEGLEARALGAVADEIELKLAGAEEGGGGFEQQVHAFESHEAADEGGAEGAGGARRPGSKGEAGGVDGVFGEEDRLGVEMGRQFPQGGAGGGDEGCGVAAGAAEAGKEVIEAAEAAGGIFFLTTDVIETLGPRDTAVERAEHERDADAFELGSERAGGGG